MIVAKKKHYWNREECEELAKKYLCASDFKKKEPRAYKAAQKYGWLSDYNWFIPHYHVIKWDYTSCYNEAGKYSSRIEFQNKNESAYKRALKHKWLDDYYWMQLQQKPKGFWDSFDAVKEESAKYGSRSELYKHNQKAYESARKHKWLKLLYPSKSDPKEKIRYVYSYEFVSFNAVYVGLTVDKERRHLQHKGLFGSKIKSAVLEFAQSNNIQVPEPIYWYDKCTMEESKIKEKEVLDFYKGLGWLILNKAKTGIDHSSLGSTEYKWTKTKCYNEALNCNSRTDFAKKSSSAYAKALKNGWINDYFWFKEENHKKWTRDACYKEAKKYRSKGEFCKENHSAYQVASKNKWLDDYFWFLKVVPKHPHWKWKYESCKEEALKCSSRSEFARKAKGAYEVSRINKWLDEFFPKVQ